MAVVVGAASDLLPVPGFLAAALVFPEGIHSDHPYAYFVLALGVNFALFFGIAYYVLGLLAKRRAAN